MGGHWSGTGIEPGDFRSLSPRFSAENVDRNLALVEALREVAEDIGASPAQAAIAWVAARGSDIVPLIGAKTRGRLAEALSSTEIGLTDDQLARIDGAVPAEQVAGGRYPAAHMAMLDSER